MNGICTMVMRLTLVGLLAIVCGCASYQPINVPASGNRGGAAAPISVPANGSLRAPASGQPAMTIRGQNQPNASTPGSSDYLRYPMPASGSTAGGRVPAANPQATVQLAQASQPPPGAPAWGFPTPPGPAPPPVNTFPPPFFQPEFPVTDPGLGGEFVQPGTPVPFDVRVQEARTGRLMFGVGVNSEAGLTGQVVIDERNFDFRRIPTSFEDFVNGSAFRGAGQGFRLEAMPGNQVQRYLVSFTEPYLAFTPFSLNVSGFLFDRRFNSWDEQRLGGRGALGYRLTHDLSLSAALRAENVDISNPRTLSVPELNAALGDHDLFSGRVTLAHDTRDVQFAPTEGHYIEMSYEQVFGSFDYPRGEIDLRKYFLVRERPDGSGRHTFSASIGAGFTGGQTPVFENFFAGGFSTLRGFDFRGASPVVNGVIVGGEFRLLGSFEYMFPLTADDMLRGVVFCDYGTVEQGIEMHAENFRVAPGFGLRIAIPALGPAPLAIDLAVPVAHAPNDDIQNISFFFGFGRI